MKKALTIMMTVLLISALFISCSQQIQEDSLGSVSISLQESRTLSAATTSSINSIDQLVWYYTAEKTSGLYATGQTTALTMVPAGINDNPAAGSLVKGTSLGDFSTGNWLFSFYGFNSAEDSATIGKAVYYATNIKVTVVADQSNPVDIPLSVGDIGKGKVVFNNLSLDLTGMSLRKGGVLTLNIKQNDVLKATFTSGTVNGATIYALSSGGASSVTISNLDPGTYTYTFSVVYAVGDEDGEEVAEEEWRVTVNNGTIVTFTGDIFRTEGEGSVVIGEVTGDTTADANVTSTSSNAVTVSAPVSPASASDPEAVASTIVDFPQGSLKSAVVNEQEGTTTSYNHDLKVEVAVKNVDESAFVIGTTSTSVTSLPENTVAGIDLTLTQTATITDSNQQQVSQAVETLHSFENNAVVTVSTYIATGLTGVDVYFGESNTFTNQSNQVRYFVSYDDETGLLVFQTNHFSKFWVVGIAPVEQCNHPNLAGTFCLDCQHPVAFIEELDTSDENTFVRTSQDFGISNPANVSYIHLIPSSTEGMYDFDGDYGYSTVGEVLNGNLDPSALTLYIFSAFPPDDPYDPNDDFCWDDIDKYVIDNGVVREATATELESSQTEKYSAHDIYSYFSNWSCDYCISFSDNIAADSCFLVGSYSGMTFAIGLPELTANTVKPLLGSVFGVSFDYAYMCNQVEDFLCGFYNMNPVNVGKTLSVILRMTDPNDNTNYINVCQIDYLIQ